MDSKYSHPRNEARYSKIQIAAGKGNRDGSPVFDGEHPVAYFSGIDSDLLLPLPETAFADGFED